MTDPLVDNSDRTKSKIRLEYLDGLRGIAALYVVLYHIYNDVSQHFGGVPRFFQTSINLFLAHGRSSVAIFIVLSGYCLMLPVARSTSGDLKGGFFNYIKRRSRRILPPYYAALIFSLLFTGLTHNWIANTGRIWNIGQPAFALDNIIAHFLLIHNLNQDWIFKINPVMWSVALEWQIYFIFPLLFLPVWRRLGVFALLATSYGLSFALKNYIHLSSYWFVILFAIGMVGAIIGFSDKNNIQYWKVNLHWETISTISFVTWIVVTLMKVATQETRDILLGIAAICFIISCTQFIVDGKNSRFRSLLSFLESHFVITLGTFSYSLYLTHALVLALLEVCLSNLHLPGIVRFIVLLILVIPCSILVAHRFYLVFEKPFINNLTTTKSNRVSP